MTIDAELKTLVIADNEGTYEGRTDREFMMLLDFYKNLLDGLEVLGKSFDLATRPIRSRYYSMISSANYRDQGRSVPYFSRHTSSYE